MSPDRTPAAASAAAAVWVPPVMEDQETREIWVLLGQALVDHGIPAGGDRHLRAGVWAQRMGAEQVALASGRTVWREGVTEPDLRVADAITAVRAGLGVTDLFAISRAARLRSRLGLQGRPNGTALSAQTTAANVLSFLSVRAMAGWLAAEGAFADTGDRFGQVHAWAAAGMAEDGWVYAAAGLSVGEALAARKDGSLSVDEAGLLAALRGVALPPW